MKNEVADKAERGSIVLETGIVLPIFILVFLFLYGLMFVVSAQNQVTAAMFQSSKSLSLDPYITEHVDSVQESKTFWSGLGSMIEDLVRNSNSKYFASASDWYSAAGADVTTVAKNRFIGFFAGGDEAAAKEKAKNLGIVGGLNGINISASVSGKTLTIDVNYVVQTWFDAFGLGKIPIKQKYTVTLWGVK